MIYIGSHLSSTGGFEAMGRKAVILGENTFAYFTRNPRGGQAKPIDMEDAKSLQRLMKEYKFGTLVAHAPYTMNLCSKKEDVREFGQSMLIDDMKRSAAIPGQYYNFHPGSHTGQGIEAATEQIVDALNKALPIAKDSDTVVLLETMAGKGTEVGSKFSELRNIIDGVNDSSNLGVCFDTCHVWDAGYDIVLDLNGVLQKFDKEIGLDRLKAVHFNDSMNVIGSHKDRHQRIGEGELGIETMKRIALNRYLRGKPFILETPNDDKGYEKEVNLIKSWLKRTENNENA